MRVLKAGGDRGVRPYMISILGVAYISLYYQWSTWIAIVVYS